LNKRISILVMMVFASFAQAAPSDKGAWQCGSNELRSGSANKAERASYCLRDKPYQLLSENCLGGKCELLSRVQKAKDADFETADATVGNPGFRLCRKLGGEPRVIEFRKEGSWKPFNECRFAKDKSFANVDFLLYLAKHQRPWL
jgi:hypothetical protein